MWAMYPPGFIGILILELTILPFNGDLHVSSIFEVKGCTTLPSSSPFVTSVPILKLSFFSYLH